MQNSLEADAAGSWDEKHAFRETYVLTLKNAHYSLSLLGIGYIRPDQLKKVDFFIFFKRDSAVFYAKLKFQQNSALLAKYIGVKI